MWRTTLSVIRAPSRIHCVMTRLLAHTAILYVVRLSNKTAINRMVHAAIHSSYGYGLLILMIFIKLGMRHKATQGLQRV